MTAQRRKSRVVAIPLSLPLPPPTLDSLRGEQEKSEGKLELNDEGDAPLHAEDERELAEMRLSMLRRRRKERPTDSVPIRTKSTRATKSSGGTLRALSRLVTAVVPISHISLLLLAVLLAIFTLAYLRNQFFDPLFSLLLAPFRLVNPSTLLHHTQSLAGALATTATTSATTISTVYCATIGLGCPRLDKSGRPAMSRAQKRDLELGGITRHIRMQAETASSIFESILDVGGRNNEMGLNLHHVELWELGITVLSSSEIQDKEILGQELIALGDSTRNVRDAVIRLNSRGISSFTWILHEFERIQEIIHNTLPEPPPTSGTRSSTPARLKRNAVKSVDVPLETLVSNLVSKIARDLSDILQDLDRAIPLADQASVQGGRLLIALSSEHAELRRTKEQRSVFDSLAVAVGAGSTWKSKQLQRDLALSEESVTQVATIRRGLELARSSFLEYHNNVGHFKAGIVGFHLAENGMSAAEEIKSLSQVMAQFTSTIAQAKRPVKVERMRDEVRETIDS